MAPDTVTSEALFVTNAPVTVVPSAPNAVFGDTKFELVTVLSVVSIKVFPFNMTFAIAILLPHY